MYESGKDYLVTDPVRLTQAEFEALQVRDVRGFGGPSYVQYRLQVEHRGRRPWCAVERQNQFGRPVYFARPIIITLEAAP